jgi:hypothetical protein
MGLAVVYGIVKSHDGFIEIESNSKEGTTVFCYFPASDTLPAVTENKTETSPGGSRTIFFVDDNPSLAKMGKQRGPK